MRKLHHQYGPFTEEEAHEYYDNGFDGFCEAVQEAYRRGVEDTLTPPDEAAPPAEDEGNEQVAY